MRNTSIVMLLTIALASSEPCLAAVNRWTNVGLAGGSANVTNVLITSDDTVYAVTPPLLHKSTDGGVSWRHLPKIYDLRSPVTADASTLYATNRSGLHRSADAGESWQIVNPKPQWGLAVARGTTTTLYAGLIDSLEKSADGGKTFNAITTLPQFENGFYYGFNGMLETDDADPDTVYIGFAHYLYRTLDGGQTWRPIRDLSDDRPSFFNAFRSLSRAFAARGEVIHVAHKGGVVSSFDGGRTWSSLQLAAEFVTAIVIDPARPDRSYVGSLNGAVYRQEGAGQPWTLFNDGLGSAPVRDLAIDKSGRRIYAATAQGLFSYEIPAAFASQRLPDDPLRLPRLLRQLPVGTDPVALASSAGLILPAVGTVTGAAGGVFRTDVALANRRAAAQEILVIWLAQGGGPGGALPTFSLTLPASDDDNAGLLPLSDIAAELGVQGLGSLVVIAIDSSGTVDPVANIDGFARIRSSSRCGSGTVSQSLAAIPLTGAVPHRRGRALGLRHEAEYRTNVGMVNLSDTARAFTVVVSGERTSERFTVSVPPFSASQTAVPDRDYGALSVTVISDGQSPWVAYASSVDNASGDAWAAAARPLLDR